MSAPPDMAKGRPEDRPSRADYQSATTADHAPTSIGTESIPSQGKDSSLMVASGAVSASAYGLSIKSPAATIQVDAGILADAASLIGSQPERERRAYDRGFADGRATACVFLAEMEQRSEAIAWWREWSAKLRRIIQNNDDPSVRMRQVMAEIASDQKLMRDARRKLATKPGALSPLESCALRRIRLADPGDPL